LEYWPIPFGVLQTCCKIQKYKKIIFVVFKKSMRKHIFKTSNIFYLKNVQNMLEYWSYATHKKTFILYMYMYMYVCMYIYIYMYVCIFVTLRRKSSILNARLIFFYIKKHKKKNTRSSDFAFTSYCSSELNFTWTVTNAN
jgi:hypothetical protein